MIIYSIISYIIMSNIGPNFGLGIKAHESSWARLRLNKATWRLSPNRCPSVSPKHPPAVRPNRRPTILPNWHLSVPPNWHLSIRSKLVVKREKKCQHTPLIQCKIYGAFPLPQSTKHLNRQSKHFFTSSVKMVEECGEKMI